MNARELRAKQSANKAEMKNILNRAELEDRDLSQSEQNRWDQLMAESHQLEFDIKEAEKVPDSLYRNSGRSPAHLHYGLGDSETRAIAAYVRTGDRGAISGIGSSDEGEFAAAIQLPRIQKRATDEIMNVAAAGDGGAAVPTGFSGQIAARMSEMRIADRLGIRRVPGQGTTVNYPYENADPAVFATTSEQVDNLANVYERDRPTLATKAFTLVKKTKKLVLTEELLDDEDANLMDFIADHIGRAMAMTHNIMLLTEVAANGTSLKTFASAAAIAAGEPDDLVFHSTLAYYLDDGGSIGWVMRPATYGAIKKITGDPRLYDDQLATGQKMSLLQYPVRFSNNAGAITASGKSLYFGNWYYVGMREDLALRLIRDPYTTDGVVNLKYSFRTVYGVLVAGAIGYGVHPTA